MKLSNNSVWHAIETEGTHNEEAFTASTLALSFGAYGARASDIVDTAQANGQLTTLVAAVTAAALVDTLKSDGPFTVSRCFRQGDVERRQGRHGGSNRRRCGAFPLISTRGSP